jgi:hypothetical protein
MKRFLSGLAVAVTAVAFSSCGSSSTSSPNGPTTGPSAPPELLSTTGLYTDIARKQVDPGNLPWVPNYPLWSDGSAKERWIRLPAGTKIDTSNMDRWVFPVGTKFYKEFSFNGRRVETRIMEKVGSAASLDSWTFKAYQWRPDESDAQRVGDDGVPNAAQTSFGTTHDIPSLAACRACHTRGGDAVNAFEALQLSADRDPLGVPASKLEPGDITLEDLERRGLITNAPAEQPRIVSSTPAGRLAMGFLHGNCSPCHNPQGPAATLGMDLRHTVAAHSEAEEPAYRTAVNQLTTTYAMPGTQVSVNSFRILGGSPDMSAVLFRTNSRASGQQMPPFATKVPDADAVNYLTDWIRGLPRR